MIFERPLLDAISVQTPDYDSMGFVLDVSQLGVDDFGSGSTDIAWRDWECDITEIGINRGGDRSGLEISHEVGTATIILKNAGDPLANESNLRPNQLLRIALTQLEQPDDELEPPIEIRSDVFTGWVADLTTAVRFRKGGERDTYVTATVADAIKIHNETTRYGALPPLGYETLEERLNRLSGSSRTAIVPPPNNGSIVRYSF